MSPSPSEFLAAVEGAVRQALETARGHRSDPSVLRESLLAAEAHLRASYGRPLPEDVERSLRGRVEREVAAYATELRPPMPRRGLFQNARLTTAQNPFAAAGVSTVKCESCGAARTDATPPTCSYCGALVRPG